MTVDQLLGTSKAQSVKGMFFVFWNQKEKLGGCDSSCNTVSTACALLYVLACMLF